MGQRYTLGRDQRLKSRQRIERIFREGKSMNVFPFRLYYVLEAGEAFEGGYRLQGGFGASRRHFKKAVDRNRIKRLMREAYRVRKGPLEALLDERQQCLSLFFIYTGKELPEHRQVSARIGAALEKIMKEVRL